MHFKYSELLNIIYVTFMFGIAMPVLFPIAFISILILYIMERLKITYYYRKPPMYDHKLN